MRSTDTSLRLYIDSTESQAVIDKEVDRYSIYLHLPKLTEKINLTILLIGQTEVTKSTPVDPLMTAVVFRFKKQELPHPSPDGKITVQVKLE